MIKEDLSPVAPNFNPWLEIWYRPRTTIRRIIQVDPKRDIWLLAMLFGVVRALENANSQGIGDNVGLLPILGFALVSGTIGGVVALGVYSFFVGFVGRRFGGDADNDDVAAAVAWAQVPTIFSLALWAVEILVFREQAFMLNPPFLDESPLLAVMIIPIAAIHLLLGLWQTVLMVLTIAEVNRFAVWRSIATLVLGFILMGVVIVAVVFLLFLIIPGLL